MAYQIWAFPRSMVWESVTSGAMSGSVPLKSLHKGIPPRSSSTRPFGSEGGIPPAAAAVRFRAEGGIPPPAAAARLPIQSAGFLYISTGTYPGVPIPTAAVEETASRGLYTSPAAAVALRSGGGIPPHAAAPGSGGYTPPETLRDVGGPGTSPVPSTQYTDKGLVPIPC